MSACYKQIKFLFTITLIVFFSCLYNGYSQKESTIWYFGSGSGLDFSSGSPVVIHDGVIDSLEGCATISDCEGNLLFYTNSIKVWDRNHNLMPSGSDLLGDVSTTQATVIVPKPGDGNLYYIFTLDNVAEENGLRYSLVDMSLNGGNGDVVDAQKNILLDNQSTEKLTVAGHGNGRDFWVIAHDWNNSNFQSYLVSNSGVNTIPFISAVGANHSGELINAIGGMKVSPDGKRLAIAKMGLADPNYLQIFDFDNTTGEISNLVFIDELFQDDSEFLNGPYGLEFSPNSELLYVSEIDFDGTLSKIHQLNISLESTSEIINSGIILHEGHETLGSMQLGIDQKIYIANSFSSFLSTIEYPNVIGEEASFVISHIDLESPCFYGLPQFVFNDFSFQIDASEDTCLGEPTIFSIITSETIDTILWEFGDGSTSNIENPTHIYSSVGTYNVAVTITYGQYCKTRNINVTIGGISNLSMIPDYIICDDFSNDGFETFDFETFTNEVINEVSDNFSVSYYNSYDEAELGLNPLESFYINSIINQEEVFIRVNNIENENCYQIQPFFLIVTPVFPIDFISINFELNDWTTNTNSILIIVDDESNYEYSLDGFVFQEDPFFDNLIPNEYTVYIKDTRDCGISQKQVFLVNYPSFFTPNGDGINDFWQLNFANNEPDISIFIYDRYGKLIKQIAPNSKGWDGTFNGEKTAVSDYWFVIQRPSTQSEYRGHFTLKR